MANVVKDWVAVPGSARRKKETKDEILDYLNSLAARAAAKLEEDGDEGPRANHIPEIDPGRYDQRSTQDQTKPNREMVERNNKK